MLIDALPVDVVSLIAEHTAALHPRGPPTAVYAGLLAGNKSLAAIISDPHLASIVFHIQFDVDPIKRRLGPHHLTPSILQKELIRRWTSLKRIRWAASAGPAVWGDSVLYPHSAIRDDMWVAYLLILENDGKNWDQLVKWAMLPAYVQAYVEWDLMPAAEGADLPEETEIRSLGMWLLWFMSDKRNPIREVDRFPGLTRLIRPVAFSSYAYASAQHPWQSFVPGALEPPSPSPRPSAPRPRFHDRPVLQSYLSYPCTISTPLLSEAANHIFFATLPRPSLPQTSSSGNASSGVDSDNLPWDSTRYDTDWARLVTSWTAPTVREMPSAGYRYTPGDLTGIFEGTFALPDFDTFHKIAGGEAPIETFKTVFLMSHTQAWRLEEHTCLVTSSSSSSSSATSATAGPTTATSRPAAPSATSTHPFRPGPVLGAHLPEDLVVTRIRGGIMASAKDANVVYRTCHGRSQTLLEGSAVRDDDIGGDADDEGFVEIIVTGESVEPLSGLRQATLMDIGSTVKGTIRRRDGLITLWARPVMENSGEWMYVGRLSSDGTLSGHWLARTNEPSETLQWEGVFQMHRRQ